MEQVYFCKTCWVSSCPECFFSTHVDHYPRSLLRDVYKDCKRSLTEGIQSLQQKCATIREQNGERFECEKEAIEMFFQRLTETVRERDFHSVSQVATQEAWLAQHNLASVATMSQTNLVQQTPRMLSELEELMESTERSVSLLKSRRQSTEISLIVKDFKG